jgi:hypothetical protein
MRNHSLILACATVALASLAHAGDPVDLLPGEAPVIFTGAEGEDADATILADGVSAIRGDEIWLWVPALDGGGQVDLGSPGQFFRLWDSGPEAGPDGNDDDDNGMRGMDFDPSTGTFLISYEDTTTTGFAFGNILDGDLMRLTPTAVTGGAISGFTWTRLYDECTNGTDGCIGTGDLNALCLAPDGSLYFGSGGAQTILTDVPGMLSVGSSTLVHADGITGSSPANLGPDKFFEASVSGCGVIFCPAIYTGQLRGADVLASGLVTFGTSGDYKNAVFTGPIDGLTDEEAEALAINVEDVCLKADICSVPDLDDMSLNTYQRRTGEVLYAGSLFYQAPNVGDAEILDHDIIDTQTELAALIDLLGAGSDAGVALSAHLAEVATCPADVTGPGGPGTPDGNVDALDYLLVIGQWGTPCVGTCEADITGPTPLVPDGNVDSLDFLLLIGQWGSPGVCP